MSEVIRLSQNEMKWIERYRTCQLAEARSRVEEGYNSGTFDIERYTNMSIRDLVEDMIIHSKVAIESYCKDLKIEV